MRCPCLHLTALVPAGLLLLFGFAGAPPASATTSSDAPYPVDPVYLQMRDRVLERAAEDMGELASTSPWIVLMEVGFPEGAATLVVSRDGTTSLYDTGGGGILGTGQRLGVRLASLALLKLSETLPDAFEPAEAPYPLVSPGAVQFLVVGPNGVARASAPAASLEDDPEQPLAALFRQGRQVIRQIRQLEEAAQEPAGAAPPAG